jgi:hypothetical protein
MVKIAVVEYEVALLPHNYVHGKEHGRDKKYLIIVNHHYLLLLLLSGFPFERYVDHVLEKDIQEQHQ